MTRAIIQFGLAVAALAMVFAVGGCGSAPHSQTLVDARRTVHGAQHGIAARLEPDEVRVAERSLAAAEAAANGSDIEIHHAYIADRQARLATAHAAAERTETGEERTRAQYYQDLEQTAVSRGEAIDARDDVLAQMATELQSVRGQLQERGDALDDQTRQLHTRETELSQRMEELTRERAARAQAEARMRELARLGQVQEQQDRWIITLNGEVLFETNRAQLRNTATDRLNEVAQALGESAQTAITVTGHTDSRGPDAANERLSRDRAQSVSAFLIQHGIAANRITVVGRGEAQPVADNTTTEGRANNRRVEISVQRQGS